MRIFILYLFTNLCALVCVFSYCMYLYIYEHIVRWCAYFYNVFVYVLMCAFRAGVRDFLLYLFTYLR